MGSQDSRRRVAISLTSEAIAIVIGMALIACALGARQAWLDRHFLPSFFMPRAWYVAIETSVRVGLGIVGLSLVLARLRVAQKSGALRAILWHQGESDATPVRSALYAAKLRALIVRFRADAGDPNLPFVIGQLGQFYKPGNDDVRRVDSVHRAVAASVPNVAYVSTEGLRHKGDTVHFDAASARTLGERYAMAYLRLVVPSAR